jgi:hypothetical protein
MVLTDNKKYASRAYFLLFLLLDELQLQGVLGNDLMFGAAGRAGDDIAQIRHLIFQRDGGVAFLA